MNDNPFDALRRPAPPQPRPRPSIVKIAVFGGALSIIFSLLVALPAAFFLMIALGVIHSHVVAWPALGFLESFAVAAAIATVSAGFRE